jgi:hypothetical protein
MCSLRRLAAMALNWPRNRAMWIALDDVLHILNLWSEGLKGSIKISFE